MENSSGEVMNMEVSRMSSPREMLKQSMISRKKVGIGISMTIRMTTTPTANMMSPCLAKRA